MRIMRILCTVAAFYSACASFAVDGELCDDLLGFAVIALVFATFFDERRSR